MNGGGSGPRASSHGNRSGALVSLVMPVWEPRSDWLLQSVASALDQRNCRVELVVVDDGCSVPVTELLESVVDSRVRVVRIEHSGTSVARNAGVAASLGDWIRYVDYDDVLPPDSTALLLEVAGSDDVLPYGATEICDTELRPRSKMTVHLQGDAVRACLLDAFEVTLPAFLFPRSLVERVGDWDASIAVCQDWDYLLRAFEHMPVRGVAETVLLYRRHTEAASAGSLSSGDSLRLGEAGMRLVMDRYFERHPHERGTALERQARARVELVLARSHREAYLRYLGRALAGDRSGVVRELAVFGRLVLRRALDRTLRTRPSVRRPRDRDDEFPGAAGGFEARP
jgi:hypothetical protein